MICQMTTVAVQGVSRWCKPSRMPKRSCAPSIRVCMKASTASQGNPNPHLLKLMKNSAIVKKHKRADRNISERIPTKLLTILSEINSQVKILRTLLRHIRSFLGPVSPNTSKNWTFFIHTFLKTQPSETVFTHGKVYAVELDSGLPLYGLL